MKKSVVVGAVFSAIGLAGLALAFLNHRLLYTVSWDAALVFLTAVSGFVLVHDGWHFIREGFA